MSNKQIRQHNKENKPQFGKNCVILLSCTVWEKKTPLLILTEIFVQ